MSYRYPDEIDPARGYISIDAVVRDGKRGGVLGKTTLRVSGDIAGKSSAQIIQELTPALTKHGYSLSEEPRKKPIVWNQFLVAIPLALLFLVGLN